MDVQMFDSVFDALADTPVEAANMKARSEPVPNPSHVTPRRAHPLPLVDAAAGFPKLVIAPGAACSETGKSAKSLGPAAQLNLR